MSTVYYYPKLDRYRYEHRVIRNLNNLGKMMDRLMYFDLRKFESTKIEVLRDLVHMSYLNVPALKEVGDFVKDAAIFADAREIDSCVKQNGRVKPVELFPSKFLKEIFAEREEYYVLIHRHKDVMKHLHQQHKKCASSRKKLFAYSVRAAFTDKETDVLRRISKERSLKESHDRRVERYTELYNMEVELRENLQKISESIEKKVCGRLAMKIGDILGYVSDMCHYDYVHKRVSEADYDRLAKGIYRHISTTYTTETPLHPRRAKYDPSDGKGIPVSIPDPDFDEILPESYFGLSQCFSERGYVVVEDGVPNIFGRALCDSEPYADGALRLGYDQVVKIKLFSTDGIAGFGWKRKSIFHGRKYGLFLTSDVFY